MIMTHLRKKWIAFLCGLLDHRMVVVAQDVDWGIRDTLKECNRCGHQTFERYINTK